MKPARLLRAALALLAVAASCWWADSTSSNPSAEPTGSRTFTVDCVAMSPLLSGVGNHWMVRTPLAAVGDAESGLRCYGLVPRALAAPGSVSMRGDFDVLDTADAGTLTLFRDGAAWTAVAGTLTLSEVAERRAVGTYDVTVRRRDDPSQQAHATGRFEYCDYARRSDCPARPQAASLEREVSLADPLVAGSGFASECRMLHDPTTGALVVDMELALWEGRRISDLFTLECGELLEPVRATLRFRAGGVAGPGRYGPWAVQAADAGSALPELVFTRPVNFAPGRNPCSNIVDSVTVATSAASRCTFTVANDRFEVDCSDVVATPSRHLSGYPASGAFLGAMGCDLRTVDGAARPQLVGAVPASVGAGTTLQVDLDDLFADPGQRPLFYAWRVQGSYPWGNAGAETTVDVTFTGSATGERGNLVSVPVAAMDIDVDCDRLVEGRLDLTAKARNGVTARDFAASIAVVPPVGEAQTDILPIGEPGLRLGPGARLEYYPRWTNGPPGGNGPDWRLVCAGGEPCPVELQTSPSETTVTLSAPGDAPVGTAMALEVGYCRGPARVYVAVGTVTVVAEPERASFPPFGPPLPLWQAGDAHPWGGCTDAAPIADVVGDARPDLLCFSGSSIGIHAGGAAGFGPYTTLLKRSAAVSSPWLTVLNDPNGGEALVDWATGGDPLFVPHLPSLSDDLDGDGVPNAQDGCPILADPEQTDPDGDTVTGPCDRSVDVDGLSPGPQVDLGPQRVVFRRGFFESDAAGDDVWRVQYVFRALPTLQPILEPLPSQGYDLRFVGDFGNDGRIDAFYGFGDRQGYWIEADTGFVRPPSSVSESAPSVEPDNVRQADLDGDGFVDLLDPRAPLAARWHPAGGFEFAVTPPACCAVPRAMAVLHVGDLDGDGKADLLGQCDRQADSGTLCFFKGDETFLLRPPVLAPDPFAGVERPGTLHVRDIDGDGRHDLVHWWGDRLEYQPGL